MTPDALAGRPNWRNSAERDAYYRTLKEQAMRLVALQEEKARHRAERKKGAARDRYHVEAEIRRLRKKLSLANKVWNEFEKLVPVDKAAAMELIYTSVAEPHYEPYDADHCSSGHRV